MAVGYNPRTTTDNLVLALDAGNVKSYPGSGTAWTDLTATGNPTPNTGYFGGGDAPGLHSTMDKVTYASDTTAAVPGASLSVARTSPAATGSSTAGYFGGGTNPSGRLSTMDKVTYLTDTTTAVPGAALSSARSGLAATGNSTSGYFGGGFSPGVPIYSTMDKITYSSDTTAAVPGAALSVARRQLASTGNSTAGYFGGGISGSSYSTMDKTTYSTDTTAALPSAGFLSVARYALAATGNSTHGYFGGGFPNSSLMDKVTYSTDTRSTVPGAALSAARRYLAATGSSTAGYFGGGYDGSNPRSTMDKVTYASDTTAAVPGAALSAARYGAAASSARANALPEVDSSRKNRTTLTNGATFDSQNGGSIVFDGTDDYVNFDVSNLGTTTTVEMWIKASSFTSNDMIFGWQQYDVITLSGAFGYNTNNSDIYGISAATVTSLGLLNNWAHYVFEMRSDVSYTNNKIYINGVSQSLTQVAGSENAANRNFNGGSGRIAGWRNADTFFMPMNCAIFRVYNRALTQAEISQNFNALRGRYGI